ncbi:integrase-like protein [Rhodococcus sp. OK302]|nr:integrase-like protein [Rhodococcus sp. OK302]
MEHIFAVHGIPNVVHADRGTSMTSKTVATLLADLEVTRSHSRPRVSNDNPFSESLFKTLKYGPEFPERFGSLFAAREFMDSFTNWYNYEHRHTGIGLHTPADVHFGLAAGKAADRRSVLTAAREQHPHRFGTKVAPRILDRSTRQRPDQSTSRRIRGRRGLRNRSGLTPTGLRRLDKFRIGGFVAACHGTYEDEAPAGSTS